MIEVSGVCVIDPQIEELIRDSERLRVIATLVENEDDYISCDLIRSICGFEVTE